MEEKLDGRFSIDGGKTYLLTDACFDKLSTKGRPKRKLNKMGLEVVEKLSSFMCTEEEIAAFMDVSVELLHNDENIACFTECVKKGRKKGKASLRSNQFRLSRTNATMAIWLGKQYLGQKDDPVLEEQDDPITEISVSFEDASGDSDGAED